MGTIILIIVIVVLALAGFIALIISSVSKKAVTGQEAMVGKIGVAITNFEDGQGTVDVGGEIWKAKTADTLKKGDEIVIDAMGNMFISVSKK